MGGTAFKENRALIQKTLAQAAGTGRVLVTGFSLGGALAQRAAVEFPTLISRVVAFRPARDPAQRGGASSPSRARPLPTA